MKEIKKFEDFTDEELEVVSLALLYRRTLYSQNVIYLNREKLKTFDLDEVAHIDLKITQYKKWIQILSNFHDSMVCFRLDQRKNIKSEDK